VRISGHHSLFVQLFSLPQEQLDFIEADAASRGVVASEFMKEFKESAPRVMKFISQHPKKEISVTLPEETH